jgi:hypothetical protein
MALYHETCKGLKWRGEVVQREVRLSSLFVTERQWDTGHSYRPQNAIHVILHNILVSDSFNVNNIHKHHKASWHIPNTPKPLLFIGALIFMVFSV